MSSKEKPSNYYFLFRRDATKRESQETIILPATKGKDFRRLNSIKTTYNFERVDAKKK